VNSVQGDLVIAHIRGIYRDHDSDVRYENTHPFYYKDYVFVHNGFICNFRERRSDLYSQISQDLIQYIEGETDTEILFYMILTALRKEKNGFLAIRRVFSYISSLGLDFVGNVIFSDKNKSVITRYTTSEKDHLPPLYFTTSNDGGFYANSNPIGTPFPKNTCVVLQHDTGLFSFLPII